MEEEVSDSRAAIGDPSDLLWPPDIPVYLAREEVIMTERENRARYSKAGGVERRSVLCRSGGELKRDERREGEEEKG